MIGNGNNETNFLHKLLLTNWQVSADKFQVANNSSAHIKLSKQKRKNKQTDKQTETCF